MACSLRRSSRARRPVARLIDEVISKDDIEDPPDIKSKVDKRFYEVEIVQIDPARKKMRLHLKGYSKNHDEWRDIENNEDFPIVKLEELEKPSEDTLGERSRVLQTTLYLEIKRKLLSVRRDDPEVRFELPIDEDVFHHVLGKLGKTVYKRGKTVYQVEDNSEMDTVLGTRWAVRVKNKMGDFESVKHGTVEYWLHQRPPLNDFVPIGGKFFPYKLEQGPVLVFTFVRDTGNLRQYKEQFVM